jgi:hypothetical protein
MTDYSPIECPICGSEENQFISIAVCTGGESGPIDSMCIKPNEGILNLQRLRNLPPDSLRFSNNLMVDSVFGCGNGHPWLRRMSFHKGAVQVGDCFEKKEQN